LGDVPPLFIHYIRALNKRSRLQQRGNVMSSQRGEDGADLVPRRALEQAMDCVALGILIVDLDLNVCFANAPGRRLLGLPAENIAYPKFRELNPTAVAQIKRIADKVVDGHSRHMAGVLIPSGENGSFLEAVARWLRNERCLVIYLRDIHHKLMAGRYLFADLHGLTATEAKTATLLANDHSLAEIAHVLGVSIATGNFVFSAVPAQGFLFPTQQASTTNQSSAPESGRTLQ
jgi:hypothetical protein